MVELAEIDCQATSSLICDFMICKCCGTVDREHSRMVKNSICPACHRPAGVARLYYPINIHILVDLVQQSYHSEAQISPIYGPQASNVGTILFFSSLREALLNHFLVALLLAQQVPSPLIEKLLEDNKLASQKFAGLFSAVVGKSWKEAVIEASAFGGMDFNPISDLMLAVASIRNEFMHEGRGWAATREVSTNCVNGMPVLTKLFVILHNIYVHPLLDKSDLIAKLTN